MMFLLGLTGSIGMGKSTTAKMFAALGCDVWDADAAVHRLYAKGGKAVGPMSEVFPSAIEKGTVSRERLKMILAETPDALKKIEAIVHPLVGQDRAAFIERATSDIIVLDIPLIFETGGQDRFDAVACVIVDDATQRDRVLARRTMTIEQFEAIKAKQLPAKQKAARADYVIRTDTLEHAQAQVTEIVKTIRDRFNA